MTEFQALWSRAFDGYDSPSSGGRHDARDCQEKSEDQNANELMAQRIAYRTLGRPLDRGELAIAAPAVHYAFGALMGALYGAAADAAPQVRASAGAGCGAALWVAADEIAMPLLRLSGPPTRRDGELHAQSFASHLVFGVATEAVRGAVRTALA